MVLFGTLEMMGIIEILLFFVGWGKKGQATFFGACTFARYRGCRGKRERKDFTSGPAKRVRMGRIVVKGLLDFRRYLVYTKTTILFKPGHSKI
ncbi:hypothetical protein DHD32_16280 [Arenibacter sp. TNZ]|nr:hypothetical protein [Arenibacter sp. TNZ]